jgi:hypothetical protein
MGIDELLEGKREEVLRTANKHGVCSVRVFGSYRGINLARVWTIVERRLPKLKHSVAAMMNDLCKE